MAPETLGTEIQASFPKAAPERQWNLVRHLLASVYLMYFSLAGDGSAGGEAITTAEWAVLKDANLLCDTEIGGTCPFPPSMASPFDSPRALGKHGGRVVAGDVLGGRRYLAIGGCRQVSGYTLYFIQHKGEGAAGDGCPSRSARLALWKYFILYTFYSTFYFIHSILHLRRLAHILLYTFGGSLCGIMCAQRSTWLLGTGGAQVRSSRTRGSAPFCCNVGA